ncbi:putative membrane protein [Propionispira arboris]|uniref:Putative membrane protein n=1 Tax=Propionispira arboris TaxID=84035 RepID=A0A1H7C6V1_9FIRM|nr:SHOCT domain-containing protein [Propionispira arboris]SEJ82772.1 putative membrane protein [Propionispira arboris]
MMGYGASGGFGWFGFELGMITHLAFIAIILLAVIWMFKAVFPPHKSTNMPSNALETLKSRYAKGELTSEEYQTIKKEIE